MVSTLDIANDHATGKMPGISLDQKAVKEAHRKAAVESLRASLQAMVKASVRDFTKAEALLKYINDNIDGFEAGTVSAAQLRANLQAEIVEKINEEKAEEAVELVEQMVVMDQTFESIKLSKAGQHWVNERCQIVTAENFDRFVATFRDETQPPEVQKFMHNAHKRVLTETATGRQLVADHNDMVIHHPKELKQATTEFAKAKEMMAGLLKKYPDGSIHVELDRIQRNKLCRHHEIQLVMLDLHNGKEVSEAHLHEVVEKYIHKQVAYQTEHAADGQVALKGAPKAIQDIGAHMSKEERAQRLEKMAHNAELSKHVSQDMANLCRNGKCPASVEDQKNLTVYMAAQGVDPLLDLEAVKSRVKEIRQQVQKQTTVKSASKGQDVSYITQIELASLTKSEGFSKVSEAQRQKAAVEMLKKDEKYKNIKWTPENEQKIQQVAREMVKQIDSGEFDLAKIDLKQTLSNGFSTVLKGDVQGMKVYADAVQKTMRAHGAAEIVANTVHSVLVGVGEITIKTEKYLKDHNMETTAKVFHATAEVVGQGMTTVLVAGEQVHKVVAGAADKVSSGVNSMQVWWNKEDDIKAILEKNQLHKTWAPILEKDGKAGTSMKEVMDMLAKSNISLSDYDAGRDGHINVGELSKALTAAYYVQHPKASAPAVAHVQTGSHVTPTATTTATPHTPNKGAVKPR